MRGIPKSFKTKQDILNTHKLAMRRQVDLDEWLYILNSFITPNKYVLPILKNEGNCFYIPYTELPLPEEYSNNKRVSRFTTERKPNNNFSKPMEDIKPVYPEDNNEHKYDVYKNADIEDAVIVENTETKDEPIDPGFSQDPGKLNNIDQDFSKPHPVDPDPNNPDPGMGVVPSTPYPDVPGFPGGMGPDMGLGPDYNEEAQGGGELPMLKIFADVDPNLEEIVIYYGYPILEDTLMTKEEILQMIKELS